MSCEGQDRGGLGERSRSSAQERGGADGESRDHCLSTGRRQSLRARASSALSSRRQCLVEAGAAFDAQLSSGATGVQACSSGDESSSGSSSGLSADPSSGWGISYPTGSFPSNNPAPFSSSRPGRSAIAPSPNSTRNWFVVP